MILIESKKLTYLFGILSFSGNSSSVKATAIYPFIIVKDKKFATDRFINHELIHFEQQKETLFIGLFLMHIFEFLYFKFFKKLSNFEGYKFRASEQEAYLNQDNLSYLKTRKRYVFLRYINIKSSFGLDQDGKVVIKV